MEKLIKTSIIVIVLTAIAIYLYVSNSKSTLRSELRDFAIEDTSVITKIFLVDKNNHNVTLDRKDGIWTLNKEFGVRKDFIDVLLKTICRLNVKAPVPRSAHNNIVKKLASSSTKVEIYQDDKLLKVYYVGGATPDNTGTYMLLDGSSEPFVMDIPGFSGYLTTRYSTEPTDWKDRSLFRYKYTDIANVMVENIANPLQSFKITNSGNNIFKLQSLKDQKEIRNFDTVSVKEYLGYFKNLSFETYVSNITNQRRDSVFKSTPMLVITVEDREGKKKTAKMYYRPNYDKYVDENNKKTFKWDADRLYAFINNDKDLVIIQYFVFDPVIKDLSFFLSKKTHS